MSPFYRLIVEPKGALLLGGTSQAGVNDATAREVDGVPYIPATAIKGALREQLVRILKAVEPGSASATVQRILGSAPASIIAAEETDARSGKGKERPGGGRTRVYISDARVRDDALRRALSKASSGLVSRHQVSVDRRSRRAADQRLFSREVVPPFLDGLRFVASIDATLLVKDPVHGAADLERLQAAVSAVFAIGGGRSAGLGHVTFRLEAKGRNDADSGKPATADRSGTVTTAIDLPMASSIDLVLEAEEPLCVGDRIFLANNFHASLGYIRGSTLRGALVTAAMRAQGISKDMTTDPAFARALIDASTCMRFGDAVPVTSDPSSPLMPRVAPFTLRTCKYRASEHGCLDTLVLRWIQQRLAADGSFLAFEEHCQHDDGSGRRCSERLVAAGDRLGAIEPGRRVVTRLALDTRMGRGADGKLFSIDLLDRETRFMARIDRVGDYGRALLDHAQRAPIRAGHGRGQGYGRLRIVDARIAPTDPLDERIGRFDTTVRHAWDAACAYAGLPANDPAPGRLFISATLENDLVPRQSVPGTPALEALTAALELADAKVLFGDARAGLRGGYDNCNDRFRNLEPMVRGRSCILLTVPKDLAHQKRLAAIEAAGIGTCRDQGYGRVRISDDLHRPGWKANWRTAP